MTLLPSSLYATLKRMLAEGLVEEVEGGGERRRMYGITERGREAALREVDRMATLLAVARDKALVPGELSEAGTEGA